MRLIKLFSLASIAAVVAIAFVGASSASAKGVFCEYNEYPCAEENLVNHFVANTPGTYPFSGTQLLCLNRYTLTSSWGAWWILYSNCGFSVAHNECNVSAVGEEQQTEMVRTGENEGEIIVVKGETHAICKVAGFTVVDCTFNEEGWKFPVKGASGESHGTLDLSGIKIEKTSGKLCPEYTTLKGNVSEAEADFYVSE